MKRMTFGGMICIVALAASLAGHLYGCASISAGYEKLPEGTAAIVNGVPISEDILTQEIEGTRTYMGLEDQGAWAAWLAENNYTPKLVRGETLDSLIEEEVARQGAESAGVSVSEDEVSAYIAYEVEMIGGEEAWLERVKAMGQSEGAYRARIKDSLTYQRHIQSFETDETPNEEDLLSYGKMMSASYDGAKKSSHILFSADNETAALEVLGRIKSGELSFEEAAARYSTDAGTATSGGSLGWDTDASFDEVYQKELDALEPGEMSGLVYASDGIHIIMCTEQYVAPKEMTSVDQLPSEFRELITAMLQSSMAKEAYEEWLAEQLDAADIVKAEMPSGLSYDIELSK